MKCEKCGQNKIELLVSWVCDTCDSRSDENEPPAIEGRAGVGEHSAPADYNRVGPFTDCIGPSAPSTNGESGFYIVTCFKTKPVATKPINPAYVGHLTDIEFRVGDYVRFTTETTSGVVSGHGVISGISRSSGFVDITARSGHFAYGTEIQAIGIMPTNLYPHDSVELISRPRNRDQVETGRKNLQPR